MIFTHAGAWVDKTETNQTKKGARDGLQETSNYREERTEADLCCGMSPMGIFVRKSGREMQIRQNGMMY